MIKLILVRHGQYDNTGHLSDNGREQIKMLAGKLEQYMKDDMSVVVLASPTHRTYESAEIISKAFGVEFQTYKDLLSEGLDNPMNLEGAYKLVKSLDKADIIILVTHFDYVADFPKFFSEKEWGIKLPSIEIGKGEAWIVDCEKKTLNLVN
jgi:phosphohistidine phosphatase SixA